MKTQSNDAPHSPQKVSQDAPHLLAKMSSFEALRIGLIYAIVSTLWIGFSSYILSSLVPDHDLYLKLEALKGWVWVSFTAIGIYCLTRRAILKTQKIQHQLGEHISTREQEVERYRLLLSATTETVVLLDSQKRYVAITEKVAKILNLRPQDLIGKRIDQVLKTEFVQRLDAIIDEVINTQQPVRIQQKVVIDQKQTWYDTIYSPIIENGQVTLIMAIGRDITERMEIFEELQKRNLEYRRLTDNVDDMIYQCNEHGDQIYINAKGREIEQLDPDDLVVKWQDVIHPDDVAYARLSASKLFSEGQEVVTFRTRIVGKQGKITPISHRVRVIKDAQGNLIGFFGIGRDISDIIKIEQMMTQHMSQLSTLNRVLQIANTPIAFKRMLNTMLDELMAIFVVDAADIYMITPSKDHLQYLAHYGYELNEADKAREIPIDGSFIGEALRQKKVRTFYAPLPIEYTEHRHFLNQQVQSMAITPLWSGDILYGALSIICWNKSSIPEQDRPYAAADPRVFNDEQLALLEALGLGLGISIENAHLYDQIQAHAELLSSEVEKRTEELQLALKQAQVAERTKTSLLSTVSHEMRTPLSSIIGFSGLIVTRDLTPDKAKEYANAVHVEARRLYDLINDFLDLQRIEAGRELFHFSEVDFNRIIEEVVHSHDEGKFTDAETHKVELALEPLPPLYIDEKRIRQVIVNLLSNAKKYSPPQTKITIKSWQNAHEVCFSIQDEGFGIPQDEVMQLFERFFRGELAERHRIRGTGLGLGLCRELVERHGGRIWAESAGENKGSTFLFALPLRLPLLAKLATDTPLDKMG